MTLNLLPAKTVLDFKSFVLENRFLASDTFPTDFDLQILLSLWEQKRAELSEKAAAEQNQLIFLGFLEEAGVANWEGYSVAHNLLAEFKADVKDYKTAKAKASEFTTLENFKKEQEDASHS